MGIDTNRIVERLKCFRSIQQLTRKHVAATASFSDAYLGQIEMGKIGLSFPVFYSLCRAMDISADFALFGVVDGAEHKNILDLFNKLPQRESLIAINILSCLVDTFNANFVAEPKPTKQITIPEVTEIGKQFRAIRKDLHYTQDYIAEKAEIGAKFLSDIERGKTGFSLVTFAKMCAALQTPANQIIFAKEQSGKNPISVLLQRLPQGCVKHVETILIDYTTAVYDNKHN